MRLQLRHLHCCNVVHFPFYCGYNPYRVLSVFSHTLQASGLAAEKERRTKVEQGLQFVSDVPTRLNACSHPHWRCWLQPKFISLIIVALLCNLFTYLRACS